MPSRQRDPWTLHLGLYRTGASKTTCPVLPMSCWTARWSVTSYFNWYWIVASAVPFICSWLPFSASVPDLICLLGVLWWLSSSSSRCYGVVCSLWLWYFLIILTYYFSVPCSVPFPIPFQSVFHSIFHSIPCSVTDLSNRHRIGANCRIGPSRARKWSISYLNVFLQFTFHFMYIKYA